MQSFSLEAFIQVHGKTSGGLWKNFRGSVISSKVSVDFQAKGCFQKDLYYLFSSPEGKQCFCWSLSTETEHRLPRITLDSSWGILRQPMWMLSSPLLLSFWFSLFSLNMPLNSERVFQLISTSFFFVFYKTFVCIRGNDNSYFWKRRKLMKNWRSSIVCAVFGSEAIIEWLEFQVKGGYGVH